MLKKLILLIWTSVLLYGCATVYTPPVNTPTPNTKTTVSTKIAQNFPEGFDQASKNKYENGLISTNSGEWYLENAMMGSTDNDAKVGNKSIRIKDNGLLRMNFDISSGIYQLRIKSGLYQVDKSANYEVWISTNRGSSWQKIGNTITVTDKFLKENIFNINTQQPVRFEIRKTDGLTSRINIDDIGISTYLSASPAPIPSPKPNPSPKNIATKDNNLLLGNPSNAIANTSYSNNFLMVKNAYALSYNKSKGTANWVSWHVSSAWKGDTPRQNDFKPDSSLPQGWAAISPRDYTDSGFDRGHLCPSDDRDGSVAENQETFLMTNMTPQAPENNRGVWKSLEEYGRKLTEQGYELYVIAGPAGKGGTGSNGTAQVIGNKNQVTVPASLWKIIVVLPIGQDDLFRISADTRIIAVNIPNNNSVSNTRWTDYRVSVDALERLTGFDFLSDVPADIQSIIEAKIDNQ